MAGVAVEQDSIHINFRILQVMLIKIYNFTSGTYNTQLTDAKDAKAQRTTLDYLAVDCQVKYGFFGLIPYSSVGCKIRNSL
jgi:hypothetical protein